VKSQKPPPQEDEEAEVLNRLPRSATPLPSGGPSDLELMEGIQREDPEALSQLYDRYNGILKALIYG
jgi:hypothetical protein